MRFKPLPILVFCTILAAACTDYKSQIAELQEDIYNLEVSVTELDAVASSLGALRDVLAFQQAGDYIQSVSQVEGGYEFIFKNNGKVTVCNATGGVSVGNSDGSFFWTLNGQPLKVASGNNASTAVTAKFRAQDGKRQISTDGGKNWTDMPATADSLISKVEENASAVTVTFLGGTEVEFVKENPLKVLLSGDNTPLATQGKAAVYYLISGGSVDVSVSTNLEYETLIASGVDWLSITGTKAVRTDVISFSATANSSQQMRSAQVTLKNDV